MNRSILVHAAAMLLIAAAAVAYAEPAPPAEPPARLRLDLGPPQRGMVLVAEDDLGNAKAQPHRVAGANWAITDEEAQGIKFVDDRHRAFAYHEQAVQLRYIGLRPDATYALRVHFLNVSHERKVRLVADGEELHGPSDLTLGEAIVMESIVPARLYRDAMLDLACLKVEGPNAIVSAVELWSDQEGLLGPVGSFVRFRIDAMPPDGKRVDVRATMKIHRSPWNTKPFVLTPEGITAIGATPWVDLRKLPGGANGSLLLSVPNGAKGATQFAVVQDDNAIIREIDWVDPDGTRIIVTPDLRDVRTYRDQERRYYHNTLSRTGERVHPLTRPPLMFSNAWGYTSRDASEYMVKSFRLLGFNSVATSDDAAKYEAIYGWHSQDGQYGPPRFMPFDEQKAREQYTQHYKAYFGEGGKKHGVSPGMHIFQLADEPGEIAIKDTPEAREGFHRWLAEQGVKPSLFGAAQWDDIPLLLSKPKTEPDHLLHFWARMYQRYLTPKMFALAADTVREQAPGDDVLPYVALSGHAMNFPSKPPLDMFQLAQYPGLMPGISDWMTSGSWWWDSHQSVAWSVAMFNGGARRYGDDFGKPPLSYPMMHCVSPSMVRSLTQLANNCKLISYYNYGPDYNVTEGHWSQVNWMPNVVAPLNNRAAHVDDIISPGVMRPSRVAMLYTGPQDVWWPQGSFTDKRASFLAMSHDYYKPELITEAQVRAGALKHYDALYVVDQFVSRDVQDSIASWVKGGGLLWACADAAVRHEGYLEYDLLDRLAGLKRDHTHKQNGNVDFVPVEGETALPAHSVPPLGRSRETVRPCTFTWDGATIRATYADGHPAFAEKQVGKGKLVYVGHRCGLSISRRTGKRGPYAWWPEAGRQLLTAPLFEAKVPRELALSLPYVVASPLSTDDGTVLVLFNLNAQPAKDVVVTLREPKRPHSVQAVSNSGELTDLPFEFEDGVVRFTIEQISWNGHIIAVRRKPAPADDRIERMRQTAAAGLSSDDWQAASGAAWFVGFFPDWQLGDRLPPLLKHDHWAVRRSAAESIGRLRLTSAVDAVRRALEGETDSHAQADMLMALVQLRHRDAKAWCEKLLRDADPFIRAEAAHAEALRVSLEQQ